MSISMIRVSGSSGRPVLTEEEQKLKAEQHRVWTNRLCLLYSPVIVPYVLCGPGSRQLYEFPDFFGFDSASLFFPLHLCVVLAMLGAAVLPSTPRRWKEAAVSLAAGMVLTIPLIPLLGTLGII